MPDRGPRLLVGREAELDRLDDWLEDVVAGRSRPLLLEGEPGVGKTSLLRAVRARAQEMGARSLAVTPIPTAASLALAGLGAVVGPLRAEAQGLDPAAVGPLHLALADPTAKANPLALSGGLVALLSLAAEQQPLVLIIDDGQWLDRSSAEVISAALRGLTIDPVGLLVAVRSSQPHPFEELQRVSIEGLSQAAAAELFASLRINEAVLTRCWEATRGNPLALDVILRGLGALERSGAHPLPDPLPVADSIATALRHRLAALPTATFSALVVLAADTASSPTALPNALKRLGGEVADLEPAEDAGIIVRAAGGRPSFAHPLLRASALSMAKPSQLRVAHGALAIAHEEAGELEARAWQLAAGAAGPDDLAADALDEVAAAARGRGATAVAAEGFLMAARLSAAQPARAARLLAAGDATWVVGRVAEAREILDEALTAAETPTERANVGLLLGQIELWARGPRLARDRFLEAALPLEHDDPGLAARLVGHAAFTAVVSGDIHGTLSLAERAATLAPPDDLAATVQATVTLGYLESHAADPAGIDRLEPIIEMAELLVDSDDPDVVGLLGLVGMCLTEAERLVEADRFLAAVVRRSRREGATATGALVAAILAEKHWRTGDWLEAAHLASNDVLDGATMPVNQAWASAFLAHLDAAAGRAEPCRQRAASAVRGGGAAGAGVALVWAGHAMGLLELGFGRWEEAARQLDRVAVLTESLGRHLPGAVWWQGDHIEALVRAGRRDDALRALERLEWERSAGTQRWPACVAARGRALLSDDLDAAVAELGRSIELAESIPSPFEAARSRLIRGERLLEAGAPGAEADLHGALGAFDRLGATSFAERTRALLGAPVAARSSASLTDLLTPAELRVALAVAKGSTNREVAADLFVSAKTVEYHLQNVYRKLNLRSRTELAVRVSQSSPD
jgi:DNA-binding CsgD family transcriptional regulator/DNA polymerase III delta prime subunit